MRTALAVFVFGVCAAIFMAPASASAHVPRFVEIEQHDTVRVEDPGLSQAYYGELNDFPHMFEISSSEEFDLFVQILSPDITDALTKELSVIILKRQERGVAEVVRLRGSEGTWESEYEIFGGDSYLEGPSYEKRLPAGDYAIEVSTPINEGKYVLVVGTREEFSLANYFGTIRDIARVKEFFGKSKLLVIQSLLVYVPLILIALCIAGGYFWYRRRNAK